MALLPKTDCLAYAFLILIGVLMFTSSWDDSMPYDELEHVTAGYSYLKTGNAWLNAWHPPLVKDIAAFPLLFAGLNDPFNLDCWRNHERVKVITKFFFLLGNDAQTIIRIARAPIMLCCLIFLFYFYKRIKKDCGEVVAFSSLILLGASPTFIAHSRFVHTDVLAAAGFFVCTCSFIDYLKKPTYATFSKVALLTGLSLLVKASLIFLYPFYLLLSFAWQMSNCDNQEERNRIKLHMRLFGRHFLDVCLVFALALIIVAIWYQPHVQNLSPQFQRHYIVDLFEHSPSRFIPEMAYNMQQTPALRGLVWYLTGLMAQTYHLVLGHEGPSNLFDHYYLGAKPLYFPALSVAKEPLGSLAMIVFAICIPIAICLKRSKMIKINDLVKNHFLIAASALFVISYASIAMACQLNIGIRHIIPLEPFLYLMVAWIVIEGSNQFATQKTYLQILQKTCLILTFLSALRAWPYYLSYYNELAGGIDKGYLIAVDSNYDWGTDLLRLKHYLKEQGVQSYYMCFYDDYGLDRAYLGAAAKPLDVRQELHSGQLIAVPVSRWRKIVQDSRADAIPLSPNSFFRFEDPKRLQQFCSLQPIDKVGASIVLFRVP